MAHDDESGVAAEAESGRGGAAAEAPGAAAEAAFFWGYGRPRAVARAQDGFGVVARSHGLARVEEGAGRALGPLVDAMRNATDEERSAILDGLAALRRLLPESRRDP